MHAVRICNCTNNMTEDRFEVAKQVLAGKLDANELTMEELCEIQEMVMDAVIGKMALTNPLVFSGVDNNTIN